MGKVDYICEFIWMFTYNDTRCTLSTIEIQFMCKSESFAIVNSLTYKVISPSLNNHVGFIRPK